MSHLVIKNTSCVHKTKYYFRYLNQSQIKKKLNHNDIYFFVYLDH